jgi:hypothetical protein
MDQRLICVIPGPPKRLWTMKPPTNAPAIPIKTVIMIPPGSGPGITHLASTPAMSPITISATIPMRFHLPCRHYSIPPDDTHQRNITDAVPEATIARFTPLSAGINTHVPGRIRALRSLQVSRSCRTCVEAHSVSARSLVMAGNDSNPNDLRPTNRAAVCSSSRPARL